MARVLVIDDETWGGGNVPEMLRVAGHEVIEATNGKSGLKLYSQEGADVVVFNIVSSQALGLDAIVELCSTHPGARVIATTDIVPSQWPPMKIAAFLGKVHTLRKPFTRQALSELVEEALAA